MSLAVACDVVVALSDTPYTLRLFCKHWKCTGSLSTAVTWLKCFNRFNVLPPHPAVASVTLNDFVSNIPKSLQNLKIWLDISSASVGLVIIYFDIRLICKLSGSRFCCLGKYFTHSGPIDIIGFEFISWCQWNISTIFPLYAGFCQTSNVEIMIKIMIAC